MRIFLTGADGQLGTELQKALQGHELGLGVWPAFDVRDPAVVSHIIDAAPQVVIHAAAYTDVDGAEREPELAWSVNADGTEHVARAAAHAKARLIYLSTDYVFDGCRAELYDEEQRPNPLNAYGRSKLEGERRALQSVPNAVVVRTSWLYGKHGKNFVLTIVKAATQGGPLRVVADQRGTPTYAADLALAIRYLLGTDLSGIVHAAGEGTCSWHEFATAIVEELGLSIDVQAITSAELGRPAPRPANSALSTYRLAAAGWTMPGWRDALKRFLKEEVMPAHAGR